MRKYFIIIVSFIITVLSCVLLIKGQKYDYIYHYKEPLPKRKLVKEIVVDCRNTDDYKRQGIYKKIYRKYSYYYRDSIFDGHRIDSMHGVQFYTTSYGDTVYMEYIDYTDYPRREE